MATRNEPTNKALYSRVKAAAKRKFAVYPSAYANAWLVREYKKRGGTYQKVSDGGTKKAKKTQPKYFEQDLPFKIESDGPDKISTSITKLEEQMYIYAKETEYEKAAFCRDQIKNLKWQLINS